MSLDLNDLTAFVAVARSGGFRDGARTSGASPSGLSEAVRRLEARLGVRLLHRTTGSAVPTEAGERLIQRLGPALTELEAALDVVNGYRDRPTGTLRLNVPISAARLVLPAIVPPFLAAYPDIRLEVIADDSFVAVLRPAATPASASTSRWGRTWSPCRSGRAFSALRRPPRRPISIAAAGPGTRATCCAMPACLVASRHAP